MWLTSATIQIRSARTWAFTPDIPVWTCCYDITYTQRWFVAFLEIWPTHVMMFIDKLANLWPIILLEINKKIHFVGQSNDFYLTSWSKKHKYHPKTAGWFVILLTKCLVGAPNYLFFNLKKWKKNMKIIIWPINFSFFTNFRQILRPLGGGGATAGMVQSSGDGGGGKRG